MCSDWMKVHVWQCVCSHAPPLRAPFSAPIRGPSVCTQHWGSNGGKGIKSSSASREVVADFSWTCALCFFLGEPMHYVGSQRQRGKGWRGLITTVLLGQVWSAPEGSSVMVSIHLFLLIAFQLCFTFLVHPPHPTPPSQFLLLLSVSGCQRCLI